MTFNAVIRAECTMKLLIAVREFFTLVVVVSVIIVLCCRFQLVITCRSECRNAIFDSTTTFIVGQLKFHLIMMVLLLPCCFNMHCRLIMCCCKQLESNAVFYITIITKFVASVTVASATATISNFTAHHND